MAYRDLVLHLTQGAPAEMPGRIDYAARLARHCDAQLTGLFSHPRLPLAYHYVPPELIREHAANEELAAKTAHGHFTETLQRHGIAGDWIEFQGGAREAIHHHGRIADLLLLGQPSCSSDDPVLGQEYGAALLREEVMLSLGRPVLVLPCRDRPPVSDAARILVGWNGSKEAARAVHDALPLLKKAETVTLLRVGADAAVREEDERIVAHLHRHRVMARFTVMPGTDRDAGAMLLEQVGITRADLLVIGAYGHMRWRELVFGGATETLLAESPVPVLLSH